MDAHRSGAPVLVLASHIPSRQVGTGYFQETKPEALFAQASHFCETVAHANQVERLAREDIQSGIGKRGAAVLVLPGDILAGEAVKPVHASATVTAAPRPAPAPHAVEGMGRPIGEAEKIMIFGGI